MPEAFNGIYTFPKLHVDVAHTSAGQAFATIRTRFPWLTSAFCFYHDHDVLVLFAVLTIHQKQ